MLLDTSNNIVKCIATVCLLFQG